MNKSWLVVWNITGLWLSIYWEFHHPNWRTHICQRGRYTTNQRLWDPFFPLQLHATDCYFLARGSHNPNCTWYLSGNWGHPLLLVAASQSSGLAFLGHGPGSLRRNDQFDLPKGDISSPLGLNHVKSYIYIYMCIYIYTYMCIYIHIMYRLTPPIYWIHIMWFMCISNQNGCCMMSVSHSQQVSFASWMRFSIIRCVMPLLFSPRFFYVILPTTSQLR